MFSVVFIRCIFAPIRLSLCWSLIKNPSALLSYTNVGIFVILLYTASANELDPNEEMKVPSDLAQKTMRVIGVGRIFSGKEAWV